MTGRESFDLARARLSFAAAVLHTIDLDGLERLHERLASPQALLEGFGLTEQRTAEDWLDAVRAAKALRDATRFDADVLEGVQDRLPAELRFPGEERVLTGFACPACGEDRIDALVVQEDESVRCLTCEQNYRLREGGEA